MSAPNDPFAGISFEPALVAAGRAAAERAATADARRGETATRVELEEWLGAWCDCSPLLDWSEAVRVRVLDAAWESYQDAQRGPDTDTIPGM